MIKVSVVIPVYNTERFLRECLDSIIGQSLKEIEILCINDGSKDSSPAILREYQRRDGRLVLLDQENKGPGAARNAGLKIARGEYCYFIDSDDILLPGALESLHRRMSQNQLDILYFSGESFFETEELRKKFGPFQTRYCRNVITDRPVTGSRFFIQHGGRNSFLANTFLQLYRTAFLHENGLAFDESLHIGEDSLFSFQAAHIAQRVESVSKAYYRHRVRGESLVTQDSGLWRLEACVKLLFNCLQYLQGNPVPEEDVKTYSRYMNYYLSSGVREAYIRCSEGEKKAIFKRLLPAEEFLLRMAVNPSPSLLQRERFSSADEERLGDKERVRLLTERARWAEQEVRNIRASWSYRIGRFATFLPRKMKGGLRCFQEHGLEYTWKRLLEQLRLIQYQGNASKHLGMPRGIGGNSISVIIPVYNAEKYLPRCLDSLSAQTVPPLEILCVDDGSTDASFLILSDYAAKNPLIRILSQRNQYAGAARNRGLREAKGDYVLFVDADDFVEPNLVNEVFQCVKKTGVDIAVFAFDAFLEKENLYKPANFSLHKKFLPEEDVFPPEKNAEFLLQFTTGGPVNKCFRRDFLIRNGLEFLPYRFSEDIGLVYPALASANRIAVIWETLYHWTKREGSLRAERDRFPEILMEAYERCQDIFRERGLYSRYEKSFINQAMGGILWEIVSIRDEKIRQKAEWLFVNRTRWRLEIAGRPKEYFYDKFKYGQYEKVVRKYCETDDSRPEYGRAASCRVSVVLPVYNAAQFLPELLKKLLCQTLRDIEILCVDDGSSDDSLQIAKEFAARDNRVRWFHQENQGAGVARNLGIREAEGKYLICLDADDVYAPNMLERLYCAIEKCKADIAICMMETIDYWTGRSWKRGFKGGELRGNSTVSHWDIKESPFSFFSQGPINKLYRRKFVQENGLCYSSTRVSNDISFWYCALFRAKKIALLSEQLVTVRQNINPDSITSNRGDHIEDMFISYRETYQGLRNLGLEKKYEENFCKSVMDSLWYNGKFRGKDIFVDQAYQLLGEEPFDRFTLEERRSMLNYSEERERRVLAELEGNLQKAAEEEKHAWNVKISMQKNAMANLRKIDAFLRRKANETDSFMDIL